MKTATTIFYINTFNKPAVFIVSIDEFCQIKQKIKFEIKKIWGDLQYEIRQNTSLTGLFTNSAR